MFNIDYIDFKISQKTLVRFFRIIFHTGSIYKINEYVL